MAEDLRQKLEDIWSEYAKSKADPVRIGLFGQPGAGKSSLINAIIGHDLAPVGVATDTTKGPADYIWNELALVDLPGYGTEGFPREGFLERFGILRFDALLCVASGKFRADDAAFFRAVRAHGLPCLFVRTHAASLHQRGRSRPDLMQDIRDDLARLLGEAEFPLLFVDNATGEGIAALQDAIAAMIAPARRAKFFRWAQGTSDDFLKRKRESCDALIRWYAACSAANALIPLPGAGLAIDTGLATKMHADILAAFGFTRAMLQTYFDRYEMLRPILAPVMKGAVRGATALMARFAGAEMARFVPLLGPVLAGSTGFVVIYAAGRDFADRCHTLARHVRDQDLARRGESPGASAA
jgi:GTP-binding protein EngB required for normal cell division